MTEALQLAGIALVLLWNAFFVMGEYAFVAVPRGRFDELAAEGNRRAMVARTVVRDPSRFIAGMQLGVTLSSLLLGALAAPWVAPLIEPLFGGLSSGAATALSVVIAFAVLVLLHVVLAEVIPKSYALERAEPVALLVAAPLKGFLWILSPLIGLLDWLSQRGMGLLRVPTTDELESAHSEQELRMLMRRSRGSGLLEAEEEEMLGNVFEFGDTTVEEVMVPRPDVTALPVELTPHEAMARVLEHPYTRYPVYGEGMDDVVGVLHVRTLVSALHNGGASAGDLRALLRPAHVVPETKKLGELLGELRRTKTHLAVVIDEYGSLSGIATLEDLIEEIVGEIADEFDLPDASVLRLARDRVRIEGTFAIEEFNDRFGRSLPDEDYHTVGGFVFGELGRGPAPGDRVEADGATFEVADIDGPRILHLDVTLGERPARQAEAS